MNIKKGGFTLIELLVVVAIIGILAAVVMGQLNTARAKAADVAIKAAMANARAQAQLWYDEQGGVWSSSICAKGTAGGIYPMVLNAVQKLSPTAIAGGWASQVYTYSDVGASDVDADGTGGTFAAAVCHADANGWAAITSLKIPTLPASGAKTGGWCVDYTGASKESPSLDPTAIVCP